MVYIQLIQKLRFMLNFTNDNCTVASRIDLFSFLFPTEIAYNWS